DGQSAEILPESDARSPLLAMNQRGRDQPHRDKSGDDEKPQTKFHHRIMDELPHDKSILGRGQPPYHDISDGPATKVRGSVDLHRSEAVLERCVAMMTGRPLAS